MTDKVDPDSHTTPAVTTKLRRDAFVKACDERGLKTTAAIATTIGLSEKTIGRVVDDGDDPSGRFIGRTLAAWPMFSFRSLFAVIDENTGKEIR